MNQQAVPDTGQCLPGPAGWLLPAVYFCFQAVIFAGGLDYSRGTAGRRAVPDQEEAGAFLLPGSDSSRMSSASFWQGGIIFWDIAIHLDNGIGYMKIGA